MTAFVVQEQHNWNNVPKRQAHCAYPRFNTEASSLFQIAPTLIAHGQGRSYGDAGLHSHMVQTEFWQHILAFDATEGLITCQSGITFDAILQFIVPQGFFLPVTPGTKFISLGGAIAADVHGKNHHKDGSISSFIAELTLQLDATRVVTCSPTHNADLFWATCGGMGLTGIILSATLRLKKITTAFITQETLKARNLEHVMTLFESSQRWTYSVAWIDVLATGHSRGRSLLMLGEHAHTCDIGKTTMALQPHKNPRWTIPCYAPRALLSPFNIKMFNALYFNKQADLIRTSLSHYDSFFYPLDGIHHWNRLYGRQGFVQYQCVLPKATSFEGITAMLNLITQRGQGSFLAVLKLFGEAKPQHILSFPMAGYTLALDFKYDTQTPQLCQDLDDIVLKHGGRLYLAKDAMMSSEMFQQTYAASLETFMTIRKKWGCAHLDSQQAQRLKLSLS